MRVHLKIACLAEKLICRTTGDFLAQVRAGFLSLDKRWGERGTVLCVSTIFSDFTWLLTDALNHVLFLLAQDKTELVHLQENLFQSRKEGLNENVATVFTQAEIWGTANERDLSQALEYRYEALKDRLLRDALIQQVGVTEWAALSENERFTRLAQMKLKVQALQREGSMHAFIVSVGLHGITDITFIGL